MQTTSLDLARIPAGDFLMGAADAEEDERPVHRVFVSEFFIARFPVTQDEYARFVRSTGYPAPAVRSLPLITQGGGRDTLFRELAAPYVWEDDQPPAGRGSHPVVLIGYDDALAYCAWLTEATGRFVRLPTEAEWERAARGGAEGLRYPWGDEIDASRCNYLSEGEKRQRGTRPTGTYAPNAYGLYDVCGNVWEWVLDWYAPDSYGLAEDRDPHGPQTGNMRIVRGGSWVNGDESMLRCAYRHKVPPDTYAYSIGFRIVCPA